MIITQIPSFESESVVCRATNLIFEAAVLLWIPLTVSHSDSCRFSDKTGCRNGTTLFLDIPVSSSTMMSGVYVFGDIEGEPTSPTCIQYRHTALFLKSSCGHSSLVVIESDPGRHDMSSSTTPLNTCCVGERSTLNLSRAETCSRWCGV
ncbi:hypothetical protein TNCV_2798171 [Trichonephila clavipes]|nr:hypothetical protein TNCV_2798171 [Trichonephila clavipes]